MSGCFEEDIFRMLPWVRGAPLKTATRPTLRRMLGLHTLLAGGEYPNTRQIAVRFEVSERTIRRDLEFLRLSCQAPIDFCRRRKGFYYTRPGYTLPLVRLSQGELVALFLAEGVLRQCRDTPFEADLRCAVEKLALALPDEVGLNPAELTAALSVTLGIAEVQPLQRVVLRPGSFQQQYLT
jgi:predicted DNA-binding transcriptional regulator YafY